MPQMRGRQSKTSRPFVFLCHCSEDKPQVRKLHDRLKRDGVNVWFDEKNLLPGQEWQHEIHQAVCKASAVLVCLSTRSINKSGYVQKEIKLALDEADAQPEGQIFIIPVRLENCQTPMRLRKWHWVDLFENEGYEKLCSALIAHLGPNLSEQEKSPGFSTAPAAVSISEGLLNLRTNAVAVAPKVQSNVTRATVGVHCNPKFTYHFCCPMCGSNFCPACYKIETETPGSVRCPSCNGSLLFSTRRSL